VAAVEYLSVDKVQAEVLGKHGRQEIADDKSGPETLHYDTTVVLRESNLRTTIAEAGKFKATDVVSNQHSRVETFDGKVSASENTEDERRNRCDRRTCKADEQESRSDITFNIDQKVSREQKSESSPTKSNGEVQLQQDCNALIIENVASSAEGFQRSQAIRDIAEKLEYKDIIAGTSNPGEMKVNIEADGSIEVFIPFAETAESLSPNRFNLDVDMGSMERALEGSLLGSETVGLGLSTDAVAIVQDERKSWSTKELSELLLRGHEFVFQQRCSY
jgi:hypothetical protein